MRIAIISTKPASLGSGTEVRNYYLREGLKNKFHVDYFTPKSNSQYTFFARLGTLLLGKIPYIELAKKSCLESKDLDCIQSADVIQLQELESFFAFEKYLKRFNKPIILDAHNIEYLRFLSGTETENIVYKWLGRFLSLQIKKIEINALKNVDFILTCSKNDQEYFSQYFPKSNVLLIPNGVSNKKYNSEKSNKTNSILFMGLLSYGPNNDGIRYYLDEIHPLIKNEIPAISLTIVGRNPPNWLLSKAKMDSLLHIKGFVEDITYDLERASVCICPLRYGSGTRLKILEYMQAGKAVVSTSKGVEGIDIENEKQILLADTPDAFAAAVLKLLKDSHLAKQIGKSAQEFINENYRWDKIVNQLNEFYIDILRQKHI